MRRSRFEFAFAALLIVLLFMALRTTIGQTRTRQLALAAQEGDLSEARTLVLKGANVNGLGAEGDSILMTAVRFNQPQIVALLEKHGAHADSKTRWMGAALMNRPAVAEELLAGGLDVNLKDRDGDTALAYAASWGHIEMVKLLLARGADVNNRNQRGQRPIHWAAQGTNANKARVIWRLLNQAGAR